MLADVAAHPRSHRPFFRERDTERQPLVLVVSGDEWVRTALTADLRRRFGTDYDVVAAKSGESALAVTAAAVRDGAEVALLIADQSMGAPETVEVLSRARELVPRAKRVLLVKRGSYSAAHPVVSALALGQVDYHLFNPWRPLERSLYPAVSEFLAAWDLSQEARVVPVRIVGAASSIRSHAVRDTFSRLGVPYSFHEGDSPSGRQVLAEVGLDGSRLPVVLSFDGTVLVQPTLSQVWELLGATTQVEVKSCDVAVVGAGPAGLAAAVYSASEGLETLVLEPVAPGGQAGTSSLIRNYLGFQRGISGDDLANRAVEQAWLFGTRLVLSQAAVGLDRLGSLHRLTTSSGSQFTARAVVLATGVTWRRLGVPALEALVGAGVFYGAAGAEARAMQGRDVFVVGAGNSAGQAAMHLSRYAASVTMLVRGDTLRTSMSAYLVSALEQTPNISVRFRTEVVDGTGAGLLETVSLKQRGSAALQVVPASALFLLLGAEPRTGWLRGRVARDDHGYVLTGRDLLGEVAPAWPLQRPPMHLETSRPGVFAAGDVRHRSTKRVAAAVGEGATAVALVHEYLRDPDPAASAPPPR